MVGGATTKASKKVKFVRALKTCDGVNGEDAGGGGYSFRLVNVLA
jgi:hypothetical protein